MAFKSAVEVSGVKETVANLGRLRRNIREENRAVVDEMAERLFHLTTGIVPYMTGKVYDSAFNTDFTLNPNFPVRAVGYDSSIPYLAALHEIPNRVHPTRGPRSEPKQDHFLSEPATLIGALMPMVLKMRLEAKVNRMTGISLVAKRAAMRSVRGVL